MILFSSKNRFNGTAFLEKIRGKKLVFVGDSLNRNQWTSMLCLIESALRPSSPRKVVRNENMRSLHINVRGVALLLSFQHSSMFSKILHMLFLFD